MILRVNINVREDEWPRGGMSKLRRQLHSAVLRAVSQEIEEADAMLRSVEFVKGKDS